MEEELKELLENLYFERDTTDNGLEVLKNFFKAHEWNKCENEMPTDNSEVFICRNYLNEIIISIGYYDVDSELWSDRSLGIILDVTHWKKIIKP